MCNITIVVPTWYYFANPFKLHPLAELYFATILDHHFKDDEISVSVTDLREIRKKKDGVNLEGVCSFIPEKDLYLYWIAKSADYYEILLVIKQLRDAYPKAKHIAGGVHVDTFPKESAEHFDSIITGPGEEAFIDIVKKYSANKSFEKVYKSNWKEIHYDNYPFARRHYLSNEAVVNSVLFEKYAGIKATSAMFSRGCNFKCAYCYVNIPSIVQMRSPSSIKNEISYLKDEYSIEGINLRDEMCIPLSPKVSIPYLEAIGTSGLKWRGQTRVGVSEEVLSLASQTGCLELSIGVESVSQQVLDIINKNQTIDQVKDFLYFSKKYGIKIKMCLILGLPGEPRDIYKQTIDFIEKHKPDFVNVNGFCPAPGSTIFGKHKDYAIKSIDEDWSKHAHLLYRFSDEESFGLPFEYEKESKWGKPFSKVEIIENIKNLQHYLRKRDMCY